MIYVAQGYEKSEGLPLFLRALSCFPQIIADNFCLMIDERSANSFKIDKERLHYGLLQVPVVICSNNHLSQTQSSLESCLEAIELNDLLFTLPTQKNQLCFNGKGASGYTEFLRKYYSLPSISMSFQSPSHKFLLLSDHIPLTKVSQISKETIIAKVTSALDSQFFFIKKIVFLGINPHAGEEGLIGSEDKVISEAMKILKKKYGQYEFIGPIAGDSSLISIPNISETLVISPFHDQGLSLFKAQNGLVGANISLGLPFVRLSVDHGTAPHKKAQDLSITGMIYCINLMMKRLEFNHGIK